jgi:hypothetical protein
MGAADVGALVQINLLHAHALVAGGLNALDVVHQRGHLPLVQRQDAILHIGGAHAFVGPHHAHHWDVDLRKDVDGHAQRGADAKQAHQQQHRTDGVGVLENEAHQAHVSSGSNWR